MAISKCENDDEPVGSGVHCSDNAKSSRNEVSFDCPRTNFQQMRLMIHNCVLILMVNKILII